MRQKVSEELINMQPSNGHTFAVLAHKESPYLEECILSLKNQSIKSDIFISTSTPSVFLNKISKKFGLLISINYNSRGIASDWSFAYNNCDTRYVTLAHQDDIYLPEYTESCLSIVEKEKKKNLIIFTDYNELLDNNKIRRYSRNLTIKKLILLPFLIKRDINSCLIKKLILYLGNPISCPSVMFNKHNIGRFEFSQDFLCSLDWEAWIRLIQKEGSYCYINKKLMTHRIHDVSQSYLLTKNDIRKKEEKLIFEKIWPKFFAGIFANINTWLSKNI